jgi:hypothetical protein
MEKKAAVAIPIKEEDIGRKEAIHIPAAVIIIGKDNRRSRTTDEIINGIILHPEEQPKIAADSRKI